MSSALDGEVLGSGNSHAHCQTPPHVGNEVIIVLSEPVTVNSGAFRGTGHHRSHSGVAYLGNVQVDYLTAQADKDLECAIKCLSHLGIHFLEKTSEHADSQPFHVRVEARGISRWPLVYTRRIARIVARHCVQPQCDVFY